MTHIIHQLATASRTSPLSTKNLHTISTIAIKSFSSTVNNINNPSPSSLQTQTLDSTNLLSRISPLKRILCLCPIPLGRSRLPWSGGDSSFCEEETINLNFQSQPRSTNITQMQPLKVAKYRYGERFAIGVAVSDVYLTHAVPVCLGGEDGDEDHGVSRRLVAEIVPTFRCDAHNLGNSPIFHTNLPFFRDDLLEHIGHLDIGAIVLAMPMAPARNPYCPTPTKVQLEQEQKLDQVRECLLGVLQNYVSVEDEVEDDIMDGENNGDSADIGNGNITSKHRRPTSHGPLNIQGSIDHRLSITDVLSKTDQNGNWDHISESLRQIQNSRTGMGGGVPSSSSGYNEANNNVFSTVPPEIHAAVALNAMMEKHTGGFRNRFF